MRPPLPRAWLPRLALAATIAASLATAGGAAGASSPCRLASAGEVRAAFGGSVGGGRVDTSIPSVPSCHYAVKGSNLGLSGEAVVFIVPGQTPATFALARKEIPGAAAVPGIANGAFYNPHTTAIELVKGRTVASAQGIFLNPGGRPANGAKVKSDVIALARSVAKHL